MGDTATMAMSFSKAVSFVLPIATAVGGYYLGIFKEQKKAARDEIKLIVGLVDEISGKASQYWGGDASEFSTSENHRRHGRDLKIKINTLNQDVIALDRISLFFDLRQHGLPSHIASIRKLITGGTFDDEDRKKDIQKSMAISETCNELKNNIKDSVNEIPHLKIWRKAKKTLGIYADK